MQSTIPLLGAYEFDSFPGKINTLRCVLHDLGHTLSAVESSSKNYLLGLNPRKVRVPFTISCCSLFSANLEFQRQFRERFSTDLHICGSALDLVSLVLARSHALSSWPASLMSFEVREAIRYIREKLAEPSLSVQSIADHMQLSHDTLNARFRNDLGRTVWEYVTQERIGFAEYLLTVSEIPVFEVGLNVGWQDASNFSRAFRQSVGFTPTRYRFQAVAERSE